MGEEASPAEYPNQLIGISGSTDANAGVLNLLNAPLKLGNASGAGATIQSGAGTPTANNVGGNVGDLYIRTDPAGDSTYLYRCTVAGASGAATWAAVTGA